MRDAPLNQGISSRSKLASPPDAGDAQPAVHRPSAEVRPSRPEWRSPRLAELDAQIRAESEKHQNRPQPKQTPRRRSNPLPAAVRNEITRFARELGRQHSRLFINDPKLKGRAAVCLRSQLPPWGKPGVRGHDDVTLAIGLRRNLRRHYAREYPDEKPPQIGKRVWKQICPKVITNFDGMNVTKQREASDDLIGRVRDRVNKRKRSARRKTAASNSPPVNPIRLV